MNVLCTPTNILRINVLGEPTQTLVLCWMPKPLPPRNQCTTCFVPTKTKTPNLTLKVAQGLKPNMVWFSRVYALRTLHLYMITYKICTLGTITQTNKIWNYDESRTQARWNGSGHVLANRAIWSVHFVTPGEREWLFTLSCINASGFSILSLYIFKDRLLRWNFIIRCKEGVVWLCSIIIIIMWIMRALFYEWISHFLLHIGKIYGIFIENWHLLLNG